MYQILFLCVSIPQLRRSIAEFIQKSEYGVPFPQFNTAEPHIRRLKSIYNKVKGFHTLKVLGFAVNPVLR